MNVKCEIQKFIIRYWETVFWNVWDIYCAFFLGIYCAFFGAFIVLLGIYCAICAFGHLLYFWAFIVILMNNLINVY